MHLRLTRGLANQQGRVGHFWGLQAFIWVFPKIVVPQNVWFIMENPVKMDDLGGKPTIFGNIHL